MLSIEEMKNMFLYKKPILLPQTDDRLRDSIIILNTPNLESSIKVINNPLLINRNTYKSYYIDRLYVEKINTKLIREKRSNEEQLEIYKNIHNQCKMINKTFITIDKYKNYNLFFDIHRYNQIYFENNKLVGLRLIESYMVYLSHILRDKTNKNSYQRNIMIIPVNDWIDDLKDQSNYLLSKVDNPVEAIYHSAIKDITLLKNIDIDILFLTENAMFIMRTENINDKLYLDLKRLLRKLSRNQLEDNTEVIKTEEKQEQKKELSTTIVDNIEAIINKKRSITGEVQEHIPPEIKDEIKNIVDNSKAKDEIKDNMENNKKIIEELEKIKSEKITAMRSQKNLERNRKLQEEQMKIKVGDKTVSQILEDIKDKTIEPYNTKVNTSNEELKVLNSFNFDKEYNKKLLKRDTIAILNSFKDKRFPIFIRDIKTEDTSDSFTLKETWTVSLENADRKRSTMTFDLPKFINEQFMYINGNKKNIIKQITLKPIVKTREDIVQISSNYNKIFVYRYGQKISPILERLKKSLITYSDKKNVDIKYGSNKLANVKYITTMEYDDLGSTFMHIKFKNGNSKFSIYFNQDEINSLILKEDSKIKLKNNELFIGFNNDNPIILNTDTNKIKETNLELGDYIIEQISRFHPEFKQFSEELNVGKKFLFTRAKIMEKYVPLIILLAYSEGLTKIMKRACIKFEFSDTRPRLKDEEKNNKGIIEFEDCSLIYDRYPFKNSLLMNGLYEIPTKNWKYEEFDNKDVYIELFDLMFNSRIIANGFDNFYELMIDPITYEILKDLNLPDNYTDLILLANELLQDNAYIKETDLSNYRIRSNEMINGYLYKVLSRAYSNYKNTAKNNNPISFSIPRGEVIKNILESPIIEDYSTLNPISEVEKIRGASFKGLSGMNLEHAYTLEKRSYDKTMRGIIAINSPPSGKVGIIKQLSTDPTIVSSRGYLKLVESDDELNSANVFAPSELLTPMAAQRDDAPRVAMSSTQSKHIVSTFKSDPVLIGNGMEKVLPKIISDDFAFKAKQDGYVVEINNKTNLMVIEYKDGTHNIVDLNPLIEKNGNGGFYISNKLDTKLKEGSKFKKDDIIALNDKFFTNDDIPTFKMGPLIKIAIMNAYYTYEDSIIVTEELSNKLSTEVIMKRDCPLGKNSNVDFIVKKGQRVEVGDPLIIFERSYDEDDINKFLSNIGEKLGEDIINLGKIPIKSKYSGTIEDVRIYYTSEFDELSPSLQQIIKDYHSGVNKRKSTVKKYNANNSMIFEPTEKIESSDGKIKGIAVDDGVLIEFYIKYIDKVGVGDKTASYSALKGVVCDIIPKGLEPYSEFRPDEEISSFQGPISIWARMTTSILISGFGNKVLIEMKRKLKEMYEKNEKGKS